MPTPKPSRDVADGTAVWAFREQQYGFDQARLGEQNRGMKLQLVGKDDNLITLPLIIIDYKV